MIENIGAYSQVDYDRGYQQGSADTLKECWDKYAKIGYGFFEEWLAEKLKEKKNE